MKKTKPSALTVFFTKFPRLLLAGIIFSSALAVFMSIFAGIGYLTQFDNILVWGLGLIPSTLFLPGLVMVVRKYAVEKDFVPVIPTFFKAVKENLKAFVFHGIMIYLICACSFFAILYYLTQAQTDAVFAYILTLYIMFTAILIVMLFYVPVMAVTYELRFRDIYKNSLLLVFGKILVNLLTFLFVGFFVCVGAALVIFTNGLMRVISIIIVTALLPLLVTYISIAMISKGLQENVGVFVEENIPKPSALSDEEMQAVKDSISDDDYIFINGKMIKNPNKH